MKKVLFLSAVMFVSVSLWALPSNMSVQVNEAQLRSTPSFLGKIVETIPYGERVKVKNVHGSWVQVIAPSGNIGWIQESALTKKKLVMKAGSDVSGGASTEEVALAGKGFNEDVEKQYRASADLNFSMVDKMESYTKTTDELVAFLEAGDLEGAIQ